MMMHRDRGGKPQDSYIRENRPEDLELDRQILPDKHEGRSHCES